MILDPEFCQIKKELNLEENYIGYGYRIKCIKCKQIFLINGCHDLPSNENSPDKNLGFECPSQDGFKLRTGNIKKTITDVLKLKIEEVILDTDYIRNKVDFKQIEYSGI